MTTSAPPPGFYDDGTGQPGLRWWDGTKWLDVRQPVADEVPVASAVASKSRLRPTKSTWIGGAALLFFLLVAAASSGISGFLIMLGVVALGTAIYVLIFGRRSWAVVPSRKVAGIVLAGSLVALIVGGVTAPPSKPVTSEAAQTSAISSATATPTPSATHTASAPKFTSEEPADPATVTIADTKGTVAIASTDATNATAAALLETLPVKGRAPMTGYARVADFGTAWLDVDRNGCDTRNDILARDLTDKTLSGSCKVLTGTLANPYLGNSISFVRGAATSALVQIDHVVSLGDAWQTGAQQLTLAQRTSLANDPLNLLAVDGKSNDQKGDGDAATWLPANKSFRCDYVARQVSVKVTYGLWVTQAEHDAIAKVLATCTSQPALTSSFAPAPVVVAPPVVEAPAPAPVVVAPAPAPVAPAPAPAPATITPGAICPDASVGQTGYSDKGKAYVCGKNGADANGHNHWNA